MDRFDNLTLRERITAHLRGEILSNRIAPGTVLQEVPLAESLGTSRGPIREALGVLAAEGLVTITPRRGAVVTTLTKEEFLEAYQVREVLEALGARLAVPVISAEGLGAMTEAIGRMQAADERHDVDLFFDANTDFHSALMDASGNRKLVEVHHRLVSQMGPYRRPSARLRGNLERSIAEHQAILDAVRARDVERATALVVEHVRVPQRRLETLTEQEFARESGVVDASLNGAATA
ncbi:MAG: GntR family transcriptional regulator [Chloroflexota bacterium]